MPSSYPDLNAEPTIIVAGGLTITSNMQLTGNRVINTYVYDAQTPGDMPTNIEAKVNAINQKQSV